MSANCGVCGLLCEDEKSAIKCSGKCGALAHNNCVNSASKTRFKWTCDTCKETSSVSSVKSSTTAITKEFLISTLDGFKQEVFNELKTYSKEFKDFKAALEFFSAKVDNATDLMREVKEDIKHVKEEVKRLKEENLSLHNTVVDLETRMRDMEQYSRINNIEISGVPESENEDMDTLLTDIAKAIDVEHKASSVEAAHRVPSYNRKRVSPIVVKFKSRRDKEVWINGFKKTRPLTADKINPHMNKDKVFINEHLSPANKLLLSRTKEAARDRGYKFIWTKDGKIFARKDSGDRVKRIASEASLRDL